MFFGIAELLIFVVPVSAGILAGRYLRRLANFCLMIVVFYIGSVMLAFFGSGEFRPLSFLAGIFVSAGSLIPPLIFILVARMAHRRTGIRLK